MAVATGLFRKVYSNSGSYDTPVFVEETNVQDLDVTDGTTAAPANNRSTPISRNVAGLTTWQVTFTMLRDINDTFYTAVRDAHRNRTAVELAIASGDLANTGEDAIHADWLVSQFDDTQPLDDTNVINVTLDVFYTDNLPEYLTTAGP